ncbi:MAG: L-threonylcarbamoyladenylate synthase [Thermoprotei archaeon]|jgi:L-threonylcarbamoyladenylate synthase
MLNTVILKIDPKNPDIEKIRFAANAIKNSGLVAFPTETVYGLGANALDEKAVEKIFMVKNRPTDNPIIVHIADINDLYILAEEIPNEALELASKFWPGPLTLLLKKSELVPDITTAGLDTVAVRMPNHLIALMLIKESEVPIAAPSANISGKPSPTTAEHVIRDLSGRIDVIIDGGEVTYGVESTVLDLTSKPPYILRPGPVTLEEIKSIIKNVEVHPVAKAEKPVETITAKSPGMKYRHYAPSAELIIIEGDQRKIPSKVQEIANVYIRLGKKVSIIATEENATFYTVPYIKIVGKRNEPKTIAKNLFKTLRELDDESVDIIIAEGIEPTGIGLAIMNRLRKAAGYNIIYV